MKYFMDSGLWLWLPLAPVCAQIAGRWLVLWIMRGRCSPEMRAAITERELWDWAVAELQRLRLAAIAGGLLLAFGLGQRLGIDRTLHLLASAAPPANAQPPRQIPAPDPQPGPRLLLTGADRDELVILAADAARLPVRFQHELQYRDRRGRWRPVADIPGLVLSGNAPVSAPSPPPTVAEGDQAPAAPGVN